MAKAALQPIAAWRNEAFALTIQVPELDLTGRALRMQVRLAPDTPGAPLIDLVGVANANAQGLRLASVATSAGVPTSTIMLRINRTALQGLPYSGELGDATPLAYALQIGGVTRLFGGFHVLAHAIDSDAAPANRAAGWGAGTAGAPRDGLVLTIGDGGVTVRIADADLIAPLAAQAASSALTSEQQAVIATAKAAIAQIAATDAGAYLDAVQQLTGGSPTTAQLQLQATSRAILAGFTGLTVGRQAYLSEPGREGSFIWVGGNQSALVAADPLQGVHVPPAATPNGSQGTWRRVMPIGGASVTWFGATGNGVTDDTPAIQGAITYVAGRGGGAVFFPRPAVKYLCNGAFQDPTNSNAILMLPIIPTVAGAISLALIGDFPVATTTGDNNTDIVIETTKTGPGNLLGGLAATNSIIIFGNDPTFINLTIENLAFRTPINSKMRAIDLRSVRNTLMRAVRVDVPRWEGAGAHPLWSIDIPEPTNGLQNVGIWTPQNGVATTCRFDNVYVAGYAYGAILGELTVGDLTLVGCRTAVGTTTGTHASIMQINVYNCSNTIEQLGALLLRWSLRVENNSPEDSGPSWVGIARRGYQAGVAPKNTDGYNIYDPGTGERPGGVLSGELVYDQHEPTIPFSVHGATDLKITTLERQGAQLGGGYGYNIPFPNFTNVAARSSTLPLYSFAGSTPWVTMWSRVTNTDGGVVGAISWCNQAAGYPDFRVGQIDVRLNYATNSGMVVLEAAKDGEMQDVLKLTRERVLFGMPDIHLATANANNDCTGGMTLAGAATLMKTFAEPYPDALPPTVTLTPLFDVGAGVRYWYEPVGAAGNWTGFRLRTSGPVSGTFAYQVIGNGV